MLCARLRTQKFPFSTKVQEQGVIYIVLLLQHVNVLIPYWWAYVVGVFSIYHDQENYVENTVTQLKTRMTYVGWRCSLIQITSIYLHHPSFLVSLIQYTSNGIHIIYYLSRGNNGYWVLIDSAEKRKAAQSTLHIRPNPLISQHPASVITPLTTVVNDDTEWLWEKDHYYMYIHVRYIYNRVNVCLI